MKKIFLMLTLFGIAFNSISQDVILKRNNEKLNVKIIEISSSEIKYKMWGNEDGPLNLIKKGYVHKITYQNGSEEKFAPMYRDADRNYDKRRNTGTAVLLSILYPGAGQIYNKDYGKAALVGGIYSFGIFGLVMENADETPNFAVPAVLMSVAAIWGIVDASVRSSVINHRYNLASSFNNEHFEIKLQPQFSIMNNYAHQLKNDNSLIYGATLKISLK